MDISKLDFNYIELFDSYYAAAESCFPPSPADASAKQQKKIRKWLTKYFLASETFPQKVMKYISQDVSDRDFFLFLKACHDHVAQYGTHKKQLFDKFSSELSEDVKSALWSLLDEDPFIEKIQSCGSSAKLVINNFGGLKRTLILNNVSCLPEGEYDVLSFTDGSLVREDSEYRLVGQSVSYDEDASRLFAIRFTDASVETQLYKAIHDGYFALLGCSPTTLLQSVVSSILGKHRISADYLNESEKALLPLLEELDCLLYPFGETQACFPELRTVINQHHAAKLLTLITQLENPGSGSRKKARLKQRFISMLNKQEYEPLWRSLYERIRETQEEYPDRASLFCPPQQLQQTREAIAQALTAQGYCGSYPDFVKQGSLRGIHLAESYNISYLVTGKEKTVSHIKCVEDYYGDCLEIRFLCGTKLLRKDTTAGDIYSCMFQSKGRCFFETVTYQTSDDHSDDLNTRVGIAVKLAELGRLTRAEREEVNGPALSKLALFFIFFIAMGGLFSVAMTLSMMLLGVLCFLIAGMPEAIPAMFTEFTWLKLLIMTWVLYGGIMGFLTVCSTRK